MLGLSRSSHTDRSPLDTERKVGLCRDGSVWLRTLSRRLGSSSSLPPWLKILAWGEEVLHLLGQPLAHYASKPVPVDRISTSIAASSVTSLRRGPGPFPPPGESLILDQYVTGQISINWRSILLVSLGHPLD